MGIKSFILKIRGKFKKPESWILKWFTVIFLIVVFFITVGLAVSGFKGSFFEEIKNPEKVVKEEKKIRRFLDGVFVESSKVNLHPVSVMVENMVDSRPPSGLSRANLVWEALTEGEITRFLAVYSFDQDIAEIGPVRSARPYFLDWAKELKALYAHVGGSPEALSKIYSERIFDLNEYWNSGYFWRSKLRLAPHNLYTSSSLMKLALQEQKALPQGRFKSWLFKDDLPFDLRPPEEKNITINFSDFLYRVDWKYDRAKNDYLRLQAGSVHEDADRKQIRAKNVIIQYVSVQVIDGQGRRRIETIGQGKAVIFQDGRAIQGQWKKSAPEERTRFYREEGREIQFNAGTTWIEVVPMGYYASYN